MRDSKDAHCRTLIATEAQQMQILNCAGSTLCKWYYVIDLQIVRAATIRTSSLVSPPDKMSRGF